MAAQERRLPLPHQEKVEKFYNSTAVQIFVAIVIGANFLTNMIEKQIDPYGDLYSTEFKIFDYIYNVIFTVELGVNLYGHWWCEFWKSGWNVFDAVVVSIGVVNMLNLDLPPWLSLLRMMRAFRVFRLFKRVKSLNKIIVAIVHAVPGVLNAFLILAIVMSIYAILAVTLFQDVGEFCMDSTHEDRFFKTIRGNCAGQEYFGTFSKSLYSFFQVLTGESWSEAVARPVIFYYSDDPLRTVGSGLFFVSYVIFSAFVLTNVVVAVLLDKMVDPEVDDKAEAEHPDHPENEANRVDAEPPQDNSASPDPNDRTREIDTIETQVSQLASFSANMRRDFDTTRKDMATLREQLDTILGVVQESNGRGKPGSKLL